MKYLAILLALLPMQAQALLLCLGAEPRFSLVSDGETVQFDYVGDGTFQLETPLALPLEPPVGSGILTAGYVIPFVLRAEACQIMTVTQPLTIELIVPSNGAEAVFRGCCVDRRPVPNS